MHQSDDISGVLVVEAIIRGVPHSVVELVQLGDEERGYAGDTGDDRAAVAGLQRRDRHGIVVDECGL